MAYRGEVLPDEVRIMNRWPIYPYKWTGKVTLAMTDSATFNAQMSDVKLVTSPVWMRVVWWVVWPYRAVRRITRKVG